MKTDKKKLMRKLIAVGLMASMLTANTMTCGSSLILPGINAEAFSAETETKLASITKTFDISALAESFNAETAGKEYIEIVIDQSGTYKFTGTNYNTAGSCYIDVQVTVNEGVTADFIFDNCTILNNCDMPDCGSKEYPEEAFVIDGTVNIYVKSTSKIAAYNNDYGFRCEDFDENAITFTGSGTVNVMESEDKDQWLKISAIDTASLNVYGGNLSTYAVKSANFKTTDGMVFNHFWDGFSPFIKDTSITYEGGNVSEYGNNNYYFINLPENVVQVTDINGIKQEHAYLSDHGRLYTYLNEEFSAENAPYIVAGGDLFVFTDFDNRCVETHVNLGDPAKLDDLKITKEYDGTTCFGNQTIEQITMNGYTLTPDLSAVTLTGSDVGEYTATVPFNFTENATEYTFRYSVPVEITAKELTAKITANNKVYDKSAEADVEVTFEGLADGDTLTEDVDYTITAEFADENVGTGKTVTATITLADTVKNYTLEKTTYETTADIIAKGVTIVDAVVESKTYDGKTDAKVTSVTFKNEKGEIVTPEYEATAVFTDASAGEDKDVIVTVTLKDSTYTLTESKFTAKADIVEPVDSFVERLYTKLLGRESDEEGKKHNVGLIEENGYTAADIASGFVMSEEIKQKNLSNEEFVTRMYNTFMDREPDEGGLSNWVSALDDGCSYAYVLKNFIGSQEFNGICEEYGMETGEYQLTEPRDMNRNLTKFAARMYTKALGRPFDVDGINDWTNRYLTDVAEIEDIAYGFIFSTEFKNKNLNDSDYVDTLYRTFFDREPDEGGKQHWLEQLKNGASREDVMYGFVGSQECINLVNSFNI